MCRLWSKWNYSHDLIFHLCLVPLTLNTCRMDGNMHGNDMQIRSCIVKLGVVNSIYGDFWEESGWRFTYTQSSPD